MKSLRSWIRNQVTEVVTDDEKRFQLELVWVFRIVALIAAVMIAVNLIVGELTPNPAILGFGGASLLLSWLIVRYPRWRPFLLVVMLVSITALFSYFIITGQPQGFSPIWICVVPPVALLLLGRWQGGALCLTLLALQIFLMWTGWGQSLLQYEYSAAFLTRLPLVYIAAFGVGWFLEYVREVTQKKLVATQRTLEHLYRHDALTGAMNRYGFNEHLARVTQRENPEGLALMFMDLDDFKQTNDCFGHLAGDTVLCRMSEVISRLIGDAGELSRWGGEEFAVIMYRAAGARDMAEAIRSAIAAMRIPFEEQSIQVSVSMGLTVSPGGPVSSERFVTLTDQSLYRAKAMGKNQVVQCEYTPPPPPGRIEGSQRPTA